MESTLVWYFKATDPNDPDDVFYMEYKLAMEGEEKIEINKSDKTHEEQGELIRQKLADEKMFQGLVLTLVSKQTYQAATNCCLLCQNSRIDLELDEEGSCFCEYHYETFDSDHCCGHFMMDE